MHDLYSAVLRMTLSDMLEFARHTCVQDLSTYTRLVDLYEVLEMA